MKKVIRTNNAPEPIGPYNQAIEYNGLVFLSGQVAIDPKSGELQIGDIKSETKQVMENIRHVLMEAGVGFENIIKTSIFLSDMGNFASVNEIYASYFKENHPARETVQVARLPLNANVEISVIAHK